MRFGALSARRERANEVGHIVWQCARKVQALAGHRVFKCQFRGMQGLSLQAPQRRLGRETKTTHA